MINYDKLDDVELWKRITENDTKAFNTLFEKYFSKIYATAFFYLKDNEACREIVNDIFISIWNRRKELHIASFTAYFTTASRYHVYNKIKVLKAKKLDFVENYDTVKNIATNVSAVEDKMNLQDIEQRIEVYLADLPKRCREIFVMSRQQHLSNDEIAEKFNISKRTVENQLTIALRHLRVSLKHTSIVLILLKTSVMFIYMELVKSLF